MNIYLKLFFASGVPYGIVMGVIYSLCCGFFLGILAGLFSGILFGGFMSLILGFLQSWSVKRISSEKSDEVIGVHHTRTVELRLPYDRAFNLCIESLKLIKKCNVQKEDRSHGKIIAKACATWKSWGEIISFDICKIDDERTQVTVSSRPVLRTTLVDYSKNLENVESIIRFFKRTEQ